LEIELHLLCMSRVRREGSNDVQEELLLPILHQCIAAVVSDTALPPRDCLTVQYMLSAVSECPLPLDAKKTMLHREDLPGYEAQQVLHQRQPPEHSSAQARRCRMDVANVLTT
jgi:hypothetical protein